MPESKTNRDMIIRNSRMLSNPAPQMPICLCIDTSRRAGFYQDKLAQALNRFYENINSNKLILSMAEISIITYGNGAASQISPFDTVRYQDPKAISRIHCSGDAVLGAGVEMAVKEIDKVVRTLRKEKASYYFPWLVIMHAGNTDDNIDHAVHLVHAKAVVNSRLHVIPISIDGKQESIELLSHFSEPGKQVCVLSSGNFDSFFDWLHKSITSCSSSTTAAEIKEESTESWNAYFAKNR